MALGYMLGVQKESAATTSQRLTLVPGKPSSLKALPTGKTGESSLDVAAFVWTEDSKEQVYAHSE